MDGYGIPPLKKPSWWPCVYRKAWPSRALVFCSLEPSLGKGKSGWHGVFGPTSRLVWLLTVTDSLLSLWKIESCRRLSLYSHPGLRVLTLKVIFGHRLQFPFCLLTVASCHTGVELSCLRMVSPWKFKVGWEHPPLKLHSPSLWVGFRCHFQFPLIVFTDFHKSASHACCGSGGAEPRDS